MSKFPAPWSASNKGPLRTKTCRRLDHMIYAIPSMDVRSHTAALLASQMRGTQWEGGISEGFLNLLGRGSKLLLSSGRGKRHRCWGSSAALGSASTPKCRTLQLLYPNHIGPFISHPNTTPSTHAMADNAQTPSSSERPRIGVSLKSLHGHETAVESAKGELPNECAGKH